MKLNARRPNILFVTADMMRSDAMGCAGGPVSTPHLDALAALGQRFDNAYSPFPICLPARHSILSGQYAHVHGVVSRGRALPPDTAALPSELASLGYRTGIFGLTPFRPPNTYGFETIRTAGLNWVNNLDDYNAYLKAQGYADVWVLWDQNNEFRKQAPQEYWSSLGARASAIPEQHYHSTWIADETIRYLEDDASNPFFAWVSFVKPHHPFDPPEPYASMYDPTKMRIPAERDGRHRRAWERKPLLVHEGRDPRQSHFDLTTMTDDMLRRVMAMYYGTISHVDQQIGRLVDALRRSGQLDHTVIIFTSDHGEFLGDFELLFKTPNVPYESLVRVPFILWAPGLDVVPGVRKDLVSLVDVMPTLLEMVGASVPPSVQGKSLLDRQTGTQSREAVFTESGRIKAVRTERYKYMQLAGTDVEELYDLENDPEELENLAGLPALSRVVQEHRNRLIEWMAGSHYRRYQVE